MINQPKAKAAIAKLIEGGYITNAQGTSLIPDVDAGKSFADFCIAQLGPELATRYLAEEFMEHLKIHGERIELDKVSVPEHLLTEAKQEWHTTARFVMSGNIWAVEEAAEPWHPSLKKDYKPSPEVGMWFNKNPTYIEHGMGVLASMQAPTRKPK